MIVMVYGGAGFLGSWVVDLLVARGHEVHVYDDGSTAWLNGEEEVPPEGTAPGGPCFNFRNPAAAYNQVEPPVIHRAVFLNCRYPLEPSGPTYFEAVKGYAWANYASVYNWIASRKCERVLFGSATRWAFPARPAHKRRDPFVQVVNAAREIMLYLHRPPTMAVEFVHLPELYGPRQLPDLSPLMRKSAFEWENPCPYGYLAYVEDAAEFLVDRLEGRARLNPDTVVGSDLVACTRKTLDFVGRDDPRKYPGAEELACKTAPALTDEIYSGNLTALRFKVEKTREWYKEYL